MTEKSLTIITIICSLIVFVAGLVRLFTEFISSAPLIIAFVFVFTGLLGAIINGVKLRKIINKKT